MIVTMMAMTKMITMTIVMMIAMTMAMMKIRKALKNPVTEKFHLSWCYC